MLVRAHAHYGYCGAEEVYEEKFENSATDEEIEKAMEEIVLGQVEWHWEKVDE